MGRRMVEGRWYKADGRWSKAMAERQIWEGADSRKADVQEDRCAGLLATQAILEKASEL